MNIKERTPIAISSDSYFFEEDKFYLQKIIELSKQRGIELVVFTAPIYNYEETYNWKYPKNTYNFI